MKRKAPVCGTMFKLTHDDETKYEWKQFVIIVRQKKIRKRILQHYCEKNDYGNIFILVSWSLLRNKWTDHGQQGQQWTKKEEFKLER